MITLFVVKVRMSGSASGDWRRGVCCCQQSEQEWEQQQGCSAGLTAAKCAAYRPEEALAGNRVKCVPEKVIN